MFGRTDLAIEHKIKGSNYEIGNIKITEVNLTADDWAKTKKKPGRYFTIASSIFVDFKHDEQEDVAKVIGEIVKSIFSDYRITLDNHVLVVGLGNASITPDALGPSVLKHVFITKHLYDLDYQFDSEKMGIVSAITPGVMGQTGMESSDIIKALVQKENPDIVIVIDALASKSLSRINQTIQISTAGINPGSGVGNSRKELSMDTLGVPVIAIGVPTVVDVASIASDAIDYLASEMESKGYPEAKEFHKMKNKKRLISEIMNDSPLQFMATPKEIDELIYDFAKTIARGINMGLHRLEEI